MSEVLLQEIEAERRDEQQQALRGLLRRPIAGNEDAALFALVRKHERALRARVFDLLGYRLAVHADHARLYRQSWRCDTTRPGRIPRSRDATDRWPVFGRRHYLLLLLTLAVLQDRHSRLQLPLSDLADEVAPTRPRTRDRDRLRPAGRAAAAR
jgi:uncharacterized protein DUF2398